MIHALPSQFIERMKKQLPETEWEAFFSVYGQKSVKGVRLNPLKGGVSALKPLLPFLGDSIAWEENGFYTDADHLGANPFHYAGLFYSQEPSAMSASPLLAVQGGEKVLDLCSAPGGKGTQLACAMGGQGLIVLNEPVFARAKILSGNVERLGIKNAVVTSELPEKLSTKFPAYFDKILVDAPCSGEGMFRKNAEEAISEWSEENVILCAERQRRILDEAVKMLKAGGKLVYSTCTFAPQEDEEQVQNLLTRHADMRLLSQQKTYPHTVRGEGHFVALFERVTGGETALKGAKGNLSREGERAYKTFEKSTINGVFARRLYEAGGVLYDLPEHVFDWSGLQVLRVGVRLGEIINGRLEPSHSFAMCLKKEEVQRAVDIDCTDPRIEKYLRGETIEAEIENGWCLVCVCGYPIGWGKAVNGVIKNHLPKGLRRSGIQ